MEAYLKTPDDDIFVLEKKVVSIGRSNCDLVIAVPGSEEKHATIEYNHAGDSYVLTDLNTPAGTLVNGCPLRNASVRLTHGDVIRFGDDAPGYEFCLEEPAKGLHRLSSTDSTATKILPPILPSYLQRPPTPASGNASESRHSGPSQSRPSSGHRRGRATPIPPSVASGSKPSSALRRALSQGNLAQSTANAELPFLQKSRSGGDSLFLDYLEKVERRPERSHPFPKVPVSPVHLPPDLDAAESSPYASYTHPIFRQNSIESSWGPQRSPSRTGDHYHRRGEKEEADLRHFSDQVHDLKAMEQDVSFTKMQTFLELREKEARMVRDELSRLHRDKKALSDLLSQMAKDLVNRDAALKLQERRLHEKEAVLKTYVRGLQSKEEFIMEQVRTIQQKDEVLREQTQALNEKDDVIRRLEKDLIDKIDTIKDKSRELIDKENIVEQHEEVLKKREEGLEEQKRLIEIKDKKLKKNIDELRQKDDIIKAQTQCLLDKEDRITEQSKALENKTRLGAQLEETLRQRDILINDMGNEIQRYGQSLENVQRRLKCMFELYVENVKRHALEESSQLVECDLSSMSLEALLPKMESALKQELMAAEAVRLEVQRLDRLLQEEREAKAKLEEELAQALDSLEIVRRTTADTIRSLEEVNVQMKESFEVLEIEKKETDEELVAAKERCRLLEESEKEFRKKVSEAEVEMEAFRRQVAQATYAVPGTLPPSGTLPTKTIVAAIEQLATERNELSRKIAELKGALRQRKLTSHEEAIARKALQETLDAAENRVKTGGRWSARIEEALQQVDQQTILPAFTWVKDFVAGIYREEAQWQKAIEAALVHCQIPLDPTGPTETTAKDCSTLIVGMYTALQQQLEAKEQRLQELDTSFTKFREDTQRLQEELQQRLTSEAEEKLRVAHEKHEIAMKELREELIAMAEEERENQVRNAVEAVQLDATREKEELLAEKTREIEEMQQTLEKTLSTLHKKDEEIQDLMNKLAMAEQEIQGKSDTDHVQKTKLEEPKKTPRSSDIVTSDTYEKETDRTHFERKGETDGGVEAMDYQTKDDTTSSVEELSQEVVKLRETLQLKNQEIETLQEDMKELQEKSNQLMEERMRRPSSVPVSRKGRYAMNLERLVQNLSIENASYKLQLEQRDTMIVDLKQQIGTLKQRHLPVNVAELQQREMDEVMERLREKESHMQALRHDTDRLLGELNKRDVFIAQLQHEIRKLQQQQQHSSLAQMEADEVRKALMSDDKGQSSLLQGGDHYAPSWPGVLPHPHQLIRCRHCKHNRSKLLQSLTHRELSKNSRSKTRSGMPLLPAGGLSPELEIRRPPRRLAGVRPTPDFSRTKK